MFRRTFMKEEWKVIPNYEEYYKVSNTGKVYSLRKQKELKAVKDNHGYLQVTLCGKNNHKNFRVHRLVALSFLEKVEGKNEINHIDEDKINNNVNNLEWCNGKYNSNYGTRNERIVANSKIAIKGINVKTNETIYFNSMREAEKRGFHCGHISYCISGKLKTHKGYKWFKAIKEV